MAEHDYEKFPELTNKQLEQEGFNSPHKQLTEDFQATIVRVHDGDTFTLRISERDFDFPVRLLDIDTKEIGEGGEEAQAWAESRLKDEEVQIKINKKNRVDKYGRLLGKVVHQGADIGETQLRMGLAVKFTERNEHKFPNLGQILSPKQWFK